MTKNDSDLTSVSDWIKILQGVFIEQETIQDANELSKAVHRLIFHTNIQHDISDEPDAFKLMLNDCASEKLKDE